MKCSTCPVPFRACLGESVPRVCQLVLTRSDYRRFILEKPPEAPPDAPRLLDMQEVFGLIKSCPYRGSVLPISIQPSCGCSELSECGLRKGNTPGRVSLGDCMRCVVSKPSEVDQDLR